MAAALLDPKILVVFLVVHHLENIDHVKLVSHSADQPVAVVPHIKHHTVSDQVSRAKGLLESAKVLPVGIFCQLMPCGKISSGLLRISLSRVAKTRPVLPFYEPHSSPTAGYG